MKIWQFILAAAVLAVFLTLATRSHAQALAPAADVAPAAAVTAGDQSQVSDVIATTVSGIAAKYPVIVTILSLIGALRTVFKPLVSWYESRVAETTDTADDARLAAWKTSWWFRILAWGLDFGASIKVGPRK